MSIKIHKHEKTGGSVQQWPVASYYTNGKIKLCYNNVLGTRPYFFLFVPREGIISCRSYYRWGTAVAQCLRYCVTNRKVAGSISDGVIGIFH